MLVFWTQHLLPISDEASRRCFLWAPGRGLASVKLAVCFLAHVRTHAHRAALFLLHLSPLAQVRLNPACPRDCTHSSVQATKHVTAHLCTLPASHVCSLSLNSATLCLTREPQTNGQNRGRRPERPCFGSATSPHRTCGGISALQARGS